MGKINTTELEETMKTLVDFAVAMAISQTYLRMALDLYEKNPKAFWAMFRSEHNNLILNCRM